MHRLLPIALVVGVTLIASLPIAHAAPTPARMFLRMETRAADLSFIDELVMHGPRTLNPNASLLLEPVDPDYGPSVDVSYQVSTDNGERTVTFRFESLDGPFFVAGAIEDITPPSSGGTWTAGFGFGQFADDERDDSLPYTSRRILANDFGVLTSSVRTSPGRLPGSLSFEDSVAPNNPAHFFRLDEATIFEQSFTYTLIPEPGALGLIAAGSLTLLRRRQG